MVTVAGLRRSGGVNGRAVHLRTDRGQKSAIHCSGSQLGERLGDLDEFDPGSGGDRSAFSQTGSELGEDFDRLAGGGWDYFEPGTGDPDDFDSGARGSGEQWIGSDEVFGVRVCDVESSAVQDACDETSTTQVEVRPLRRKLHTPVCTLGLCLVTSLEDAKYCNDFVCLSVCLSVVVNKTRSACHILLLLENY